MSKFLDHDEMGPAIRQLMKGTNLRCAVAFWGVGATRALFNKSQVPDDARLICDISMGGTNPTELKGLGAPRNAKLRHLPGLHAKVYLSDEGLITGSSNASNNGIGFLDVAKLTEAGTFHAPGSDAYKQAAAWFERVWKPSKKIGKRKPRAGIDRLARVADPKSLLDTVSADPGAFRGVGFVFSTGRCTEKDRDDTRKAVIAEDDALDVPLISKSARKELADWNVDNVFGDWSPQDISAWPKEFVCAHRGGRGAITYWFYDRSHTAVLKKARGMVLATQPRGLRQKLGFAHGRTTMAQVDAKRLARIFDHLDEGHKLYESGEKLAEVLAELNLLR